MLISAPVTDAVEFLVRPHGLHVLDGLLDAGPGLLAGDALSDPEFVAAKLIDEHSKNVAEIHRRADEKNNTIMRTDASSGHSRPLVAHRARQTA